ncbi:MAG: hypothetical protein ABI696_14710 [Rubrivivax sp.]
MKQHLSILRSACAAALVLGSGLAMAQEATRMSADANKDGFVSRQEYMDYHTKMWETQHGMMMKSDKSMKPDMMSMAQYQKFNKSLYLEDGRVDPGKVGGK